ncbi:MAG: peptide deformylase [Chloroflexi bacterium]|nr:peptide deformylase [Chloroflexota bacterium]
MYRTMYGTLGVGLAAPQVGIPWRLSVIDMQDGKLVNDGKLILINPEIVETYAGETKPGTESCLSIPFYTAKVPRFQKIKVKNHRLDNTEEYIEAEDFFARVIQHEMDHLNGQVYLDRITNTDIQPEPGAHITSYARRAVSKLMVHNTIKEVLEGMA